MTEVEYEAVVSRSQATGLTVPSYLAVCGLRPEGVAAADIAGALINARAARRVLSGVANNLNQLTAKLHSTGEVDTALPSVLAAVQRYAARIDEVIAEVGAIATSAGPRKRRRAEHHPPAHHNGRPADGRPQP